MNTIPTDEWNISFYNALSINIKLWHFYFPGIIATSTQHRWHREARNPVLLIFFISFGNSQIGPTNPNWIKPNASKIISHSSRLGKIFLYSICWICLNGISSRFIFLETFVLLVLSSVEPLSTVSSYCLLLFFYLN